MKFRSPLRVAAVLALSACVADSPTIPGVDAPSMAIVSQAGDSYIVLANGNALPSGFEAAVEAAGGTITARIPEIGVVVVTAGNPDFAANAAKVKGVGDVMNNPTVQWVDPGQQGEVVGLEASQAAVGDVETFRAAQWAPDAVSAPAAWETGARGAGARVAIIDGGIRSTHIDIAPNLDVARSASFVPGQPYNFDTGTFWHGTHVAGIVAAPANGIGTVGIAPEATLIGVKALHSGSGDFSWVIQAVVYAATPIAQGGAGADIINMSLGAGFFREGRGAAQLAAVMSRATTYAYQNGVTVIASAGNSAADLDHTANVIFIPGQSTHVINVAATGPMGFAQGETNFDRPASYTNFGQSAITLAGPGGDFALPGSDVCAVPRNPTGALVNYCWVFDMVLSTSGGTNGSYAWAAGTSMAAPAVAGVAALIVGKYGKLSPSQVEAILRASADDLGKPGNDDYYGRGRVNALRAVSN